MVSTSSVKVVTSSIAPVPVPIRLIFTVDEPTIIKEIVICGFIEVLPSNPEGIAPSNPEGIACRKGPWTILILILDALGMTLRRGSFGPLTLNQPLDLETTCFLGSDVLVITIRCAQPNLLYELFCNPCATAWPRRDPDRVYCRLTSTRVALG